jgi:hypothetical protein
VDRSISVAPSAKSAWVLLLETNEAFRFGPWLTCTFPL